VLAATGPEENFRSLPDLYQEIREIEHWKFHFGEQEIVFLEDLRKLQGKKIPVSWDEMELLEALETGNRTKEAELLKNRLKSLAENGDDSDYQYGIREIVKIYDRFRRKKGICRNGRIFETFFYSKAEIEEGILELMIQTHKDSMKNEKKAYSRNTAGALRYIEQHYQQNLSVTEIADSLGVSEGHLRRVFREEMHMTLGDYLVHFRIQKAKEMLHKDNFKISQIYEKAGFTSSQYFSSVFKKMEGISPKEYQLRVHEK
jgi:YesN/AraC family two-component response regulator